jgi:hypothetical protein
MLSGGTLVLIVESQSYTLFVRLVNMLEGFVLSGMGH